MQSEGILISYDLIVTMVMSEVYNDSAIFGKYACFLRNDAMIETAMDGAMNMVGAIKRYCCFL